MYRYACLSLTTATKTAQCADCLTQLQPFRRHSWINCCRTLTTQIAALDNVLSTERLVESWKIMPAIKKRRIRQNRGITKEFLKEKHTDSKLASACAFCNFIHFCAFWNYFHIAYSSIIAATSTWEIYWSHGTWELLQEHENLQYWVHISEDLYIYMQKFNNFHDLGSQVFIWIATAHQIFLI